MARILIVHGAGMSMRGKVQTEIFGKMTLPEYDEKIRGYAAALGVDIEIFHSNIEGEIVNKFYVANDAGVDAAIVLTPAAAAIEQAFRSVKRTGSVVLVGLASGRFELPVVDTVLKGIQVRGSFLGTRQDLDEALRLAASGQVKPHVETHPLEQTPALLGRLQRGELIGRAVIVF